MTPIKYYAPYFDYSVDGAPLTINAQLPEIIITPDSTKDPGERAVLERERRKNYDSIYGAGAYDGVRSIERASINVARRRREWENSPQKKMLDVGQAIAQGIGYGADGVSTANGGVPVYSALSAARDFSRGDYLGGFFNSLPIGGSVYTNRDVVKELAKPVVSTIRQYWRRFNRNMLQQKTESALLQAYSDYLKTLSAAGDDKYISLINDVARGDFSTLSDYFVKEDASLLKQAFPNFDARYKSIMSSIPDERKAEAASLFENFPEYLYYVLETGANPLEKNTVSLFLLRLGRSVRGVYVRPGQDAEEMLTSAYPRAKNFLVGGDRLVSDGGNYLSNSRQIADRFKNTLDDVDTGGGFGVVGTQLFDFGIPENYSIEDALRAYKNQIFNANKFKFDKLKIKAVNRLRTDENKIKIVESTYMGRGDVSRAAERAYLNTDPLYINTPEANALRSDITLATNAYADWYSSVVSPLENELNEAERAFLKYRKRGSGRFDLSKGNDRPNVIGGLLIADEYINDPIAQLAFRRMQRANKAYNKIKPEIDRRANALENMRTKLDNVEAPPKKVLETTSAVKYDNAENIHGRWSSADKDLDLFIPTLFGKNDIENYHLFLRDGVDIKWPNVRSMYENTAVNRVEQAKRIRGNILNNKTLNNVYKMLRRLGYNPGPPQKLSGIADELYYGAF